MSGDPPTTSPIMSWPLPPDEPIYDKAFTTKVVSRLDAIEEKLARMQVSLDSIGHLVDRTFEFIVICGTENLPEKSIEGLIKRAKGREEDEKEKDA